MREPSPLASQVSKKRKKDITSFKVFGLCSLGLVDSLAFIEPILELGAFIFCSHL